MEVPTWVSVCVRSCDERVSWTFPDTEQHTTVESGLIKPTPILLTVPSSSVAMAAQAAVASHRAADNDDVSHIAVPHSVVRLHNCSRRIKEIGQEGHERTEQGKGKKSSRDRVTSRWSCGATQAQERRKREKGERCDGATVENLRLYRQRDAAVVNRLAGLLPRAVLHSSNKSGVDSACLNRATPAREPHMAFRDVDPSLSQATTLNS